MMYGGWPVYVPVAKKRQIAEKKVAKLKKQGVKISPVQIEGRKITKTFWGDAWCNNLESYSDFENRLPRGRTYVRNGSVIDLKIDSGKISAMVSGSAVYNISISIKPISERKWTAIKEQCAGKIGSVVELLQGKLSDNVMEIVTRKGEGLFPAPSEIGMDCDCPDWAGLCKHLAAVLYGVGARLDHEPEMLFKLRGIDSSELVDAAIEKSVPVTGKGSSRVMDSSELSDVFGVDVDLNGMEPDEADDSPTPSVSEQSMNTAQPAQASAKSRKQKAKPSKPAARKKSNSKKAATAGKTGTSAKLQQSSDSRKSGKASAKSKGSGMKTAAAKAGKATGKNKKSTKTVGRTKDAKAGISTKVKAGQKAVVKTSQKKPEIQSEIPATANAVPSENSRLRKMVSDAIESYEPMSRGSRTPRARRVPSVRSRSTSRMRRRA